MRRAATLAAAVLLASCGAQAPAEQTGWMPLEPGLELGRFADGQIRVLRVDPARFELQLLNASGHEKGSASARQWCERADAVAAINAGMYQEDYVTSVSLMRTPEHVNNPRLTRHRAVLAFHPVDPSDPPVRIIDLECEVFDDWRERYGSMVQSIRMLSCGGENVWEQQTRKTSAAAIGTDTDGRVLFVHAREPRTTHDLIDELVALPLSLTRLMYTEGGPEAQLFVRSGRQDYEFVGRFTDGTAQLGDNAVSWPIPNVVAVVRRPDPAAR